MRRLTRCCVHDRGASLRSVANDIPLSLIIKSFLNAMNDGVGDRVEPYLHHSFVYVQAPCSTAPQGGQLYKFDFIKRLPDAAYWSTSRVTEILRMTEQTLPCGNHVAVTESKVVTVLAIDLPGLGNKGQQLVIHNTAWFDFEKGSKLITKLKCFDCYAHAVDVLP